ncbi:hypothetical protein [Streptomyces sp. NPDC001536]|uniref:hypothetical protein n=1 Tax=Streptomyces sp. NPDC001536 TaxID=3364583 RepID=UPI0036964413
MSKLRHATRRLQIAGGEAKASATGTTAVGTFDYDLRGAGVDCMGLAATFSKFCNWRIDFTYADTGNRTYRTARGKTHNECRRDPLRRNSAQTLPKYGKACARFYVNGKLRATQCHFITK